MLAFEPPDWRGLLGGEGERTGEPTLGGVLACNLAGPRRVRAGSARDYFLGFSAVNGRGERWKAGGKVVKNVTGYDMCKLQAGAYGTLSVLAEVTLKVMPKPETACTLLLHALADDIAIARIVARLEHALSRCRRQRICRPRSARRSGVAAVAQGLGGRDRVAARRSGAFRRLPRQGAGNAVRAWGAPRRERHRAALDGRSAGAAVAGASARLRLATLPDAVAGGRSSSTPCAENSSWPRLSIDWGGGLVWLSLDAGDAGPDGGAARVRAAMARAGGHSTLVVAPDATRAAAPAFEPVQGALAALSKRVKTSFDPNGVFNPGRMQEGQ